MGIESTAQYTYTFNGWDPAFVAGTTITGDVNYVSKGYTQTVNKYTYTFYDEDGTTVLKTDTVDYGAVIVAPTDPTKAATAQYTYTFGGWDPAFTAGTTIGGNIGFKATYTSTVNKYTITWIDGDGGTIYTAQVAYGETPAYDEGTYGTPAKTGSGHTFTGWSPAIVSVTQAATYTAQFDSTVIITDPNDPKLSITPNPIPERTYTGGAIEPEITSVRYDGVLLTAGTDYTVGYANNVNAGTAAEVIITFIGGYGGSVTLYFTINKVKITDLTPEQLSKLPFNVTAPAVDGPHDQGLKLTEWKLTAGWQWSDGDKGKVPGYNTENVYDAVFDVSAFINNYDFTGVEGYDSAAGAVTRKVAVEVQVPKSKRNLFFWLLLALLLAIDAGLVFACVQSKKKIRSDGEAMREYMSGQKQNKGGGK
jgi:hypothetical protein